MTLSTRRGLLCGSFGMLVLAGCAADQPPPPAAAAPPPPTGVAEVGVVEVIATVESVDRTAREVLLRGPQGGLLTVRVGRQVRNFDRLRAGQRLKVSYERAVAAYIAPAGAPGANAEAAAVALRAARGQRPAGAVGDVVRVRVGIEAVDLARNTVTFVGPRGRVRTVTVKDPQMQQMLRGLKGGDQVDIVYEEALAVSILPAPAGQ